MLVTLLYFLPCIVSLLWLVLYCFKVKTPRQRLYMWIQSINVFYYATYATYISPSTDYKAMVVMDAVNIPFFLANLALIVLYLRMHLGYSTPKLKHLMLLAPALILGGMVFVLYYIIGFSEAAQLIELHDNGGHSPVFDTQIWKLYCLLTDGVFNYVGLMFGVIIIIECFLISRRGGYHFGDAYRFFFKGAQSTSSRAISLLMFSTFVALLPLSIMGRDFLIEHYLVGIGMTIIVAMLNNFISHVEFYSDISSVVTLYSLSHIQWTQNVTMVNETTEIVLHEPAPALPREEVQQQHTQLPLSEQQEEKSSPEPQETIRTSTVSPSAKTEKQAEQLRRLLEEEHIYKDENLTIATLSDRMGLGRSTLSLMINTMYGMPFRDLVSKYRIEHAKHYMLANRTATQETIAMECGFKTASYLNSKFRELEGTTPMLWLAQQ